MSDRLTARSEGGVDRVHECDDREREGNENRQGDHDHHQPPPTTEPPTWHGANDRNKGERDREQGRGKQREQEQSARILSSADEKHEEHDDEKDDRGQGRLHAVPTLNEPLADAPLVLAEGYAVRRARRLLAEEGVPELPSLPRREPRPREHVHDFVCDVSLFWRKRGRIGVPIETSANVRLEPRTRGRELVGKPVQVAYLLEQRLELPIVDRHVRRVAHRADFKRALDETFTKLPLVLSHEHAPELREPVRAVLELAQNLLPLLDRERERRPAHLEAVTKSARRRLVDALREHANELHVYGTPASIGMTPIVHTFVHQRIPRYKRAPIDR